MAMRPRFRKRVRAVRRAADGSAFEKCEECGVMIAIALFDMHECGEKKREVKRFKCISSGKIDNISKPIGCFEDEPRSPFIFFLEDFRKNKGGNLVDASRICFNVWKNMSEEEQQPFIACAAKVDWSHSRKLNEEAKRIYKMMGQNQKVLNLTRSDEDEDDSSDHFEHEFWEEDTMLE